MSWNSGNSRRRLKKSRVGEREVRGLHQHLILQRDGEGGEGGL